MSRNFSHVPNRQLRERMQQAGLSTARLAERTRIDQRTIQRWLDEGTRPQAANAKTVAESLGCTPADLWPEAYPLTGPVNAGLASVRVFASRAHIPVSLWQDLFASAERELTFCMYGGTFLFDNVPGFVSAIREAAARAVAIRFAVGDPASVGVRQRGIEEGIGEGLAARCRMTLKHLEVLDGMDGVQIRTHGEPLYTSLFRGDDILYANHHILGYPASENPVIELKRDANPELWDRYTSAIERIWSMGSPVHYPLVGN